MPLPKITASASLANSSGCCASTTTPFIDVTWLAGHAISAFQPSVRSRFSSPSAMKESSSLNPSKVRIAILIRRRFAGGSSILQEAAEHPGGLLVDGEALRQQVGGGLVVRAVGQREAAACGARHRLVAFAQDADHVERLRRLGRRVLVRREAAELRGPPRRRVAPRT